jgi:hypothetical protein
MVGIIDDSLNDSIAASDIELGMYSASVTYVDVNRYSDNFLYESVNMSEQLHEYNDNYIIKFDTACSHNMSGVRGRILSEENITDNIYIKGFNGNVSTVDEIGSNVDGKREYYVREMPADMVLLSAHDYCKDGAAILLPDSGVVLQLSTAERKKLEEYIKPFKVTKQLTVKNRTYEVAKDDGIYESASSADVNVEVAMSNTATRYFNTKVNASSSEESILAMLLTGISFNDLYSIVSSKVSTVNGIPRNITLQTLNNFKSKYGKTPDVLQMAFPQLAGNTKGYMAPNVEVAAVGD